ncbi:hypothetical protein [Methylobacterium planeticum]|uniref:Uncharacterized protein n=1 Tax=Methylobacterium planeticum TaxID=2615211 RepID=A0A6N6MK72_9HYPH|nr:hypothetical protein [Methylobacterium planeticum]KAB1069475.1 hypothetical protein F6X51_25280 [Methylobacterium planeticum]
MPWYAVKPRDPADPRWPLVTAPVLTIKAGDVDEARAKFEQAYPTHPFGTPASPVPDAGMSGFREDPDALLIEETEEPSSPTR